MLYKSSSSLLRDSRPVGQVKGGGNKELEVYCLLQAKLSQVRRKRRCLKFASAQSEEVSFELCSNVMHRRTTPGAGGEFMR